MKQAASENAAGLQPSLIRTVLDRGAALKAEGKPLISLSVGEPDFPTPFPIREAAKKALDDGWTHYGSNRGAPGLRKIIAGQLEKNTGVSYDPNWEIIVTCGGAEALNNAILAFVGTGDEVIIPTPAFVSYKNLTKLAGGVPVLIPLDPEKGFQPDPDEIERCITPRTKMLVLNNPNNPTGAVYSREALGKIAELAVKHDFLVLSDEMYSRLVYDGTEFVSMAYFPGMRERTIIVNGFSKTYAMTGWRLGYLAAPKVLADVIIKVHQYSTTCSPTFIQMGLAEALEDPETEKETCAMIERFAARRKLLLSLVADVPKVRPIKPMGAFYLMLDVSGTGLDGMTFAMRLLEEKFVATVPAVGLDEASGNFIRISYAAAEENIKEGIARMKEFVTSL
ncbi:MAG: pyridoxal phosphate-dependent aminotransferase [Stomatobaculum sp.]|nr:pyridoxal phosphate-dependent aminotransferase [Stomatobaculum sp.]